MLDRPSDTDDSPGGRRPAADADWEGREVIVLPIGTDAFSIPASDVREVIASPIVTPLPTAPKAFLGVFNARGDVVPLLDTISLLGLRAGPSFTHAVVVHLPEGAAGLGATDVPRFGRLGRRVGDAGVTGQLGTYLVGEGVTTLLELATLLGPRQRDTAQGEA